MTPAIVILLALVAISAIVAVMLSVAWHDLGQPPHARTWSAAFAMAALLWTLPFLHGLNLLSYASLTTLMPGLSGMSAAAVAIGFRQRAGLPDWMRPLLALAVVQFGALVVLRLAGVEAGWIACMTLFQAAMYLIAARTLRGRRRSERAAERLAEAGLAALMCLNLLAFAGTIGIASGIMAVRLDRILAITMTILPAIVAGIGMFMIILLTADLADQTRRLAATDLLTGLLNRRGFDAAAHAFLDAAERRGRRVVLALIDIDHFKSINDRFGHPAGDRVLRQVCARIAQGIGRRDILGRIGGEELALVLADTDLETACFALEVLRTQVETLPLDVGIRLTASFGVAERQGAETLADLCLRADRALYRAKAEGRNRIAVSREVGATEVSGTAAR